MKKIAAVLIFVFVLNIFSGSVFAAADTSEVTGYRLVDIEKNAGLLVEQISKDFGKILTDEDAYSLCLDFLAKSKVTLEKMYKNNEDIQKYAAIVKNTCQYVLNRLSVITVSGTINEGVYSVNVVNSKNAPVGNACDILNKRQNEINKQLAAFDMYCTSNLAVISSIKDQDVASIKKVDLSFDSVTLSDLRFFAIDRVVFYSPLSSVVLLPANYDFIKDRLVITCEKSGYEGKDEGLKKVFDTVNITKISLKADDKQMSEFPKIEMGLYWLPAKNEEAKYSSVFKMIGDGFVNTTGFYNEAAQLMFFNVTSEGKYFCAEMAPVFKDMENHWAKDKIMYIASKNIIPGKDSTTFAPDIPVSGEEFLSMIFTAFGISKSGTVIETAEKNGLFYGIEKDKFDPKKEISREEIAQICGNLLRRVFQKARHTENSPFLSALKDNIDINQKYKGNISLVLMYKVMAGNQEGKFDPKGNATKAQIAVIIYNLLNVE